MRLRLLSIRPSSSERSGTRRFSSAADFEGDKPGAHTSPKSSASKSLWSGFVLDLTGHQLFEVDNNYNTTIHSKPTGSASEAARRYPCRFGHRDCSYSRGDPQMEPECNKYTRKRYGAPRRDWKAWLERLLARFI